MQRINEKNQVITQASAQTQAHTVTSSFDVQLRRKQACYASYKFRHINTWAITFSAHAHKVKLRLQWDGITPFGDKTIFDDFMGKYMT